MAEYLFVLGKAGALCQAEAEAVLKKEKTGFKVCFNSPEILHLITSPTLDAGHLIGVLGGTVKIGLVVNTKTDKNKMVEEVVKLLSHEETENKLIFGLSGYGDIRPNEINHWSIGIKEELEKKQFKARFVLPREGQSLSSVVVNKQKVSEIIIANEAGKFVLAKTLFVQDFEDWGKRDFQRPAPDPSRGMLPPKVARMMVNLSSSKAAILDPFCGAGTILAEGMMLGLNVLGSDQSQQAVEKAGKNLEWLKENYKLLSSKLQLFQIDATHISEKLPADSVDAIVTEPYLGPMVQFGRLDLKHKTLENVVLGLDKLYLGCLRDWRKVLKAGGRIVIALPSFRVGGKEIFVKKALDTCENLGYTLLAGPYQYSRLQAVVIRNIYILEKNGPH